MEEKPRMTLRAIASDGSVVDLEASDTFAECVAMGSRSLWVNQSLIRYMDHQIRGLAEDASGQEDENAKWAMLESIREANESVGQMRAQGEFLQKRLDHALKCLRRKGLYAEDLMGLDRICAEKGLVKARGVMQVVRCTMGEDIANVGESGDLDETCWKIGVELAMCQHEPKLFASDALFGTAIEPNYPYIIANTMMAAYGSKLNQLLESDAYFNEVHDLVMEKYLKDPRIMADVLAWADRRLHVMDDEKDARIQSLEKNLGSEQEKTKDLSRKLEDAKRAAMPNETALQRLEDRIAALQKELDAKNAENAKYQDALDQRDRVISELSEKEDDGGARIVPLPETGVVFFGGHVNMVKKIRDAHPGWLFVDGTDENFSAFSQPALMFYWDKHMSHPAWQRARRLTGPSTVAVYLKSTNVELLEQEMSRAWSAAMQAEGRSEVEA